MLVFAALLALPTEPSPTTQHDLWPSFVVEGGTGVVRTPLAAWKPAGFLGISTGVTRTSAADGRLRLLLGAHAGVALAPVANYGHLSGTVGTAVSDYLLVALRAGPTLSTTGQIGGRFGGSLTLFHLFGPEVFVHHVLPGGLGGGNHRPMTSVFLAFSVDLPPTLLMGL